MSDLLDSLRAVNPVPSCEQPSLEDVWRKLRQHESAARGSGGSAGPTVDPWAARARRRARIGRRHPGSIWWRGGLGVAATAAVVAVVTVVVVLIGAGRQTGVSRSDFPRHAAPAAAVQRLVNGTISCDFTRAGASDRSAPVAVAARGRSAIVYCRDRYRVLEPAGAGASPVTLIACQTSATQVVVYVADGRPDQCGRLGDRALPAGYAAAVLRSGPRAAVLSRSGRAPTLSV